MRTATHIGSLLREGDRRTVGHVAEVVTMVLRDPKLVPALVDCLFEADAATRMRAADALEKISRRRVGQLQPYTSLLLGLFEESEQQELCWHLALILPRLALDGHQRHRTSRALQQCFTAKSSIVKTFALQGLADLARQEPALLPQALDALREAERNGTPAMKARSRKLLALLESVHERVEGSGWSCGRVDGSNSRRPSEK